MFAHKSKKFLIDNNLGLLFNLLYKYKDSKEISDYIYKKEKKVVLDAVKQDELALEYASIELQNDKEIIHEVLKQNRQL